MSEAFEQQAFNANLKEFATRVGYICSLESNGQMSSEDAFLAIKKLYKDLKASRRGLHISDPEADTHTQE